MNRQQRVVALLFTRRDYADASVPSPRLATPRVWDEQGDRRESSYIRCPDCRGSGRRRGDDPCWDCAATLRSGERLRLPHPKSRACSVCQVCDGTGERKRRAGEEPEFGYGVDRLRREKDEKHRPVRSPLRIGEEEVRVIRCEALDRSYRALDRVLEWHGQLEAHAHLVRWLGLRGGWDAVTVLAAINAIAERMPVGLEYPRGISRSMVKDALRHLVALVDDIGAAKHPVNAVCFK